MNESSNQSSNESIIAKMMYKKYTVQYLINKNINTMKVSRNLSWNLMLRHNIPVMCVVRGDQGNVIIIF